MSNPEQREEQHQEIPEDVVFYSAESEIGTLLPFKVYRWNRAGGSIRDHTHDYFQIWYVVKGEFIHTINQHTYRMVKGNIFVIPPYAVHRVSLVPGQEIDIIGCEFLPHFIDEQYQPHNGRKGGFDYSYLEQFMLDEEHVTPKVALSGETDLEVSRILHDMLEEFRLGKRYYELVLKADLLKLMSLLVREMARQSGQANDEDERLEKFRELMTGAINYIHEHYNEELRLEMLCRKFSISKSYFCALFKRFTGKTYNDYLVDLRVHKAAAMLLDTDMSVTDICFQVGFNDVPYFSRVFKRQTGVTPTHFKKNALSI
ncbi:helix-turn-helix domain-containing protein [Paenibacillus apiarius]|uniref:AraC family transcriptional regulator n=1 Tax=Paenibacillus apiarius TaxID=46240 RepID=A0ABT4DUB8_9BACL|nr:AraC family transcriptional regulator [Paenibacillus apiarius]MBN3523264.1 helix-turn-helix transcriptional regulator [Paenibacillus apiarius]MCY9514509.1 AraC family transcriptional regulator [Paenibacillus apiarius]MCY9520952.1 AraC family transcriptional regulator [Paenibacillus apiarius]MCY9551800.1 AraC family transcriptional regulator [Paenibacillus apiarius]MCY9557687.1 AraC family transcriptional regulator [Paenibacillus apiarius]